MRQVLQLIVWICRLAVGGLFIFSGLIKANDPLGFSYKLEEYFETFAEIFVEHGLSFLAITMEWMAYIAIPMSMFIVVLEIVLGILTILGVKMRQVATWLLLLIVFFTILTFVSWNWDLGDGMVMVTDTIAPSIMCADSIEICEGTLILDSAMTTDTCASSVSQIQLQRGVGTSTNGSSAFGASLNVETLDLDLDPFSSIATSLGSFKTLKNTFQFSTGMLNDNFSFSGRLSQINSNGYIDRAASDLDSYFFQTSFQDDNTLIKALIFGGHEITYQSWYGIDKEVLANNRTYNPAGGMYDETGNLSGFYSNQVDDYTQNHHQFHWNEKINSEWNFSLGLNYTHGSGFYEEFNDINMGGDTSYSYLQLEPYTLGNIIIDETENISQKWLDNDYYVMTFGLNHQTAVSTFNFGGLYSRYVGDHFGTLLWGQNISNALPKHRFYENQGIKTVLVPKANESDIEELIADIPDIFDDNFNYRLISNLSEAVNMSF